jgi:hypothetical protein
MTEQIREASPIKEMKSKWHAAANGLVQVQKRVLRGASR